MLFLRKFVSSNTAEHLRKCVDNPAMRVLYGYVICILALLIKNNAYKVGILFLWYIIYNVIMPIIMEFLIQVKFQTNKVFSENSLCSVRYGQKIFSISDPFIFGRLHINWEKVLFITTIIYVCYHVKHYIKIAIFHKIFNILYVYCFARYF